MVNGMLCDIRITGTPSRGRTRVVREIFWILQKCGFITNPYTAFDTTRPEPIDITVFGCKNFADGPAPNDDFELVYVGKRNAD